jgi:aminocarboxymuconate-semialdehyde decarboxylase
MIDARNRYGRTAGRSHTADGRARRPSTPTIDIHAHIVVPQAGAHVGDHRNMAKVPLAHFADAQVKEINLIQDRDRASIMTSTDQRLRDLDAMGVDI